MLTEINIDGMIGPTHHYGGLGVGNLASIENRDQTSNPRQAALEGLAKAKRISDMKIPQFIWLPPQRPNRELLQSLGFFGSLHEQIEAAYQTAPAILSAVFSSAFMWTANAATVTPAVDARDDCYHFTPANLISSLHRAAEANERSRDLANTFSISNWHVVHPPLPEIMSLRDEGAANHMRLSDPTGEIGFNIFVYGEHDSTPKPNVSSSEIRFRSAFVARQTRTASQSIARRHRLDPETTFFLQQHPMAIDAGVFHNDVIATSHQSLFIHHEFAFIDAEAELTRLERVFLERVGEPLQRLVVPNEVMPLAEAVKSYFFNSQILTPPTNQGSSLQPRWILLCPEQCRTIDSTDRFIKHLVEQRTNPIDEVLFVTVGQSMAGGGGPACLRLRVPCDQKTLAQLPSSSRLDQRLYDHLTSFIENHYPDQVSLASFCDDRFLERIAEIDLTLRIDSLETKKKS